MRDDEHIIKIKPDGHKMNGIQTVVATLGINVLALAVPVLTLQLYDRILPNPGSGTMPVLVTGVCVAIVLEGLLRLAQGYTLSWRGASYEHRLSCEAIRHLLNANVEKLKTVGIGEQMQRLAAIGTLKEFHNGHTVAVAVDLLFLPLYLALIAMLAGPLVFVPTAMLMIFTVVVLAIGQSLRHKLCAREVIDDKRYNFLIEALEGVHSIKAFVLENRFARKYEAFQEDASKANYDVTRTMSSISNATVVFSHAILLCVTCFGAVLALGGSITTGALIASVLLSGRMIQPIQKALHLWVRYQDASLAAGKVSSIFAIPLRVNLAANDINPEREGHIEFRDVSAGSESEGSLLKTVTLEIKSGATVHLSYDREESKTAFLEIMAGAYPPKSGEVSIDRVNVLRYSPAQLARHVGFIRPENALFRGTIRDNMTCFGQILESEAQEIAALFGVTQDVARLPSGFDTVLSGTSSDVISPGLRQRIAMVRILATKPRIIIYDNADRSLDRNGYTHVHSLLSRLKGKATLILVGDDENIKSLADVHLQLKDGHIQNSSFSASRKSA